MIPCELWTADARRKVMLDRIKSIVRPIYRRVVPRRPDPLGLMSALSRCQRWLPDSVATIIDVGASDGRWTLDALKVFPSARGLLIEAQPVHEPRLRELVARRPNLQYSLAAAGDREAKIHFDASDPFGGVAMPTNSGNGPNTIVVPMTTVDAAVRAAALPPPYLLKLDTHGFEVPIFEGATETLSHTSLVVVETYNFQLDCPGALRFPDMCRYLEGKGFRCCDLIEPLFRPRDGTFWQIDLAFVPISRLPLSVEDAGGYT